MLAATARSLDVPLWGWTLCYVILALIALGVWHGEKWPNNSKDILGQVLGSVLLGAVFFAVDMVLGHFFHPELPLIKAAEHSGSMFGFVLTVLVCPVLATVLLGGYFRAVFLEAKAQNERE